MGRLATLYGRMPAYAAVNRLSTFVSFALPATLGSGISVWYHGCVLWCMGDLALRRHGFSRDRPMWVATALLAVFCAANVAGFLLNGVSGAPAIELIPLGTLLGMPFLYSILAISEKDEIAFSAVAGSAAASYVAAAFAVFQFYVWRIRAEGMDGNALVFAHVVTLSGTLCVAGLALGYGEWRGLRLHGALAGGVAAAAVALVLSSSRTYWLVFPLAAGTVLLLCRGERRRFGWRGALAAALAAAAVAVIAYEPVVRRLAALGRDWQELAADGRYDTSLGFRLKLWELAAGLIREHPWIGFGSPSSRLLIERGFQDSPELMQGFSHFHNGYLTAAVEGGALGLAALLGVLGVLGAAAAKTFRVGTGRAEKLGGAILIALLLASVFAGSLTILIGHDILDATFMVCAAVGLLLASGSRYREHNNEDDAARR